VNTDVLLTLDEARVALIGECDSRSDAWPSIKTLRRAYQAKQLAVFQRVPGGRVMVWRSELMRWASGERAQMSQEGRAPQHSTAPVPPPPKHGARRKAARSATRRAAGNTKPKTAGTAKPPVGLASRREPEGVPPRLSLAELRAA
jgi:hypothetical protein